MVVFEIESSFNDDPITSNIVFSDIYGVDNLLNLDTIAIIEIPKIKFDEQLKAESADLEQDTEKKETSSKTKGTSKPKKEPSGKKGKK